MWNGGGHPFGGGYDDDGFAGGGLGVGGLGVAGAAPTGAFTRQFRAYPVSFIGRDDLERGDKIVLPPSALDSLARLNISYPMLFQLESRAGRKTHCGVLEFVADEGHANVPYWLMQNLGVEEGGMITIRNASLQKGTYVKFQPQSSVFLDIYNPKAVLEATLRGFTCLTKGDAIAISYNDNTYHINVLEVAPGDAISIIEADVNVEFAAPLDYVEPSAEPAPAPRSAATAGGGTALGGAPRDPSERLKKRLERLKKPRGAAADDSDEDDDDAGPARRVGRDSDDSDEDGGPPSPPKFPGTGQAIKASRTGSSSLTFDGGNAAGSSTGGDDSKKKADKPAKFTAFSGSGRSLR